MWPSPAETSSDLQTPFNQQNEGLLRRSSKPLCSKLSRFFETAYNSEEISSAGATCKPKLSAASEGLLYTSLWKEFDPLYILYEPEFRLQRTLVHTRDYLRSSSPLEIRSRPRLGDPRRPPQAQPSLPPQ